MMGSEQRLIDLKAGWCEETAALVNQANIEGMFDIAAEAARELVAAGGLSTDDIIGMATDEMTQGLFKHGYELTDPNLGKFGEYGVPITAGAVVRYPEVSGCEWDGAAIQLTTPNDEHVSLTTEQVLTEPDCQWVIDTAEGVAASRGGWSTKRHSSVPTTDLAVHTIPFVFEWFGVLLQEKLFPFVCSQFREQIKFPEALRVHDAFIVKYNAAAGQNSLPVHIDQSNFSFTIALNDCAEYEGGGTWFEALDQVVRVDAGKLLAFPGHLKHSGHIITSGVRYIIAVFLGYDQELCSSELQGHARYFDSMILATGVS